MALDVYMAPFLGLLALLVLCTSSVGVISAAAADPPAAPQEIRSLAKVPDDPVGRYLRRFVESSSPINPQVVELLSHPDTVFSWSSVGGGLSNINYKVTAKTAHGSTTSSWILRLPVTEVTWPPDEEITTLAVGHDLHLQDDDTLRREAAGHTTEQQGDVPPSNPLHHGAHDPHVPNPDKHDHHHHRGPHTYNHAHYVRRDLERTCATASNDVWSNVSPENDFATPRMVAFDLPTGAMLTEVIEGGIDFTPEMFKREIATIGAALRKWHDRTDVDGYWSVHHRENNEETRARKGKKEKTEQQVDHENRTFTPLLRAKNYLRQLPEAPLLAPSMEEIIKVAEDVGRTLEAFTRVRSLADVDPQGDTSKRRLFDVVWLHCDLHAGNFMKTTKRWERLVKRTAEARGDNSATDTTHQQETTWLFDWEFCHYGDRLWDLANVLLFNNLNIEESERFLNGYFTAEEVEAFQVNDPSSMLRTQLELMKWTYSLSEGMWGVVTEMLSDVPFAASWTPPEIKTYHQYGMRFLEDAAMRLTSGEVERQMKVLRNAIGDDDEPRMVEL